MKSNLLFLLLVFFTIFCKKTENFLEIRDAKGNLVAKINPIDSTGIIYPKDGNSFMTGRFINQKKEEIWTEYTNNNEKLYEWCFVSDKKSGRYYGYTLTGKIQTIGYYKDNKLDSTLVYFNLNGSPEKVEIWKAYVEDCCTSELIFSKVIK